MNYNKIKTFVLVAELGSMTEAARRLHRTFPTLGHRQPNITAANHKTLKQIVQAGYGMAILPVYLMIDEHAD